MKSENWKYLYRIRKLEIKSWMKYLMLQGKEVIDYVLGELTTGTNITINNTVEKTFYKFDIKGNSVQNGTPTPDSPVEILSSGDDINLFDEDNLTIELGSINASGGFIDSTIRARAYNIAVEPNTTYTISSSNTNLNVVPYYYNSSNTFISYSDGWKTLPYTFTTPNNTKILKLLFKNQVTNVINLQELTNIKIQKGSTVTPYSPYGMGSISEKIVNKNLIGLGTQLNGYRNNNTGKMQRDNVAIGYYFPTKLLPNTITFNALSGNRANVSYYDEIPAQGVSAMANSNTNTLPRTITVDKTYKYIHLQLSYNVTTLTEIQVEGNATATTYIAPAEQTYTIPCQQPMRSIGTVRDEFIKVNGEWKERHIVGKKIANGTEYWTKNATYNHVFFTNSNYLDRDFDSNFLLSNRFTFGGVISSSANLEIGKMYLWNTEELKGRIVICIDLDTTEEVRTWFSNNNTEFLYAKATPTDLSCTEEQISILENLPKSYDEQTNIYSIDTTPAYIEVQAYVKKEGE